jgi:hypothetical protein
MRMVATLALLLGLVPGAATACEFHGGLWGMAFARMMHAGPDAAAAASTPDGQAQANDAALAALRAQFLQRFNVKVEGEPAAAPAPADASNPAVLSASAPSPAPMP